MISCGEPSGDLYAGALVRELRRLRPGTQVVGLGGEHLRRAGAELAGDYRGLSVTGLVEAIGVLPRAWAMHRALVERARRDRPDALVVIDFPDFNFRLAASLHRLGIPVVYYVCPQVWAWRSGRLQVLKRLVWRALVIFPFEAIYRDAGIPVEFVGTAPIHAGRRARDATRMGPGRRRRRWPCSRRPSGELRAILLARAAAACHPGARRPVHRRARRISPDELFGRSDVRGSGSPIAGRTDDVLSASGVVVTASGTATVQTHLTADGVVYRCRR
jgi:lipid-A-disaccharide synthase